MEGILYAEVYLICMIVAGLLLFWTSRARLLSTSERWLQAVLVTFLVNFTVNFFFTLFSRGLIDIGSQRVAVSYALKTLYFITLDIGVFAWCGYAENEQHSSIFKRSRGRLHIVLLAVPIVAVLINLWTQHTFSISADGEYKRAWAYHAQMIYLFLCSAVCSVRLMQQARRESDPIRYSRLRTLATFPICILAAWILSLFGESIPVICVCITIELLCFYVAGINLQVSVDKLTQVNNRQNLLSYLSYKINNHEETVYLIMMDVDEFKTINDTYGHLAGDDALICVAKALKQACAQFKKRPFIARYGGDEFVVILEGTADDLAAVKERILAEAARFNGPDRPYAIGLSIGSAAYVQGMTTQELIAVADEELYKIKHARKNETGRKRGQDRW